MSAKHDDLASPYTAYVWFMELVRAGLASARDGEGRPIGHYDAMAAMANALGMDPRFFQGRALADIDEVQDADRASVFVLAAQFLDYHLHARGDYPYPDPPGWFERATIKP